MVASNNISRERTKLWEDDLLPEQKESPTAIIMNCSLERSVHIPHQHLFTLFTVENEKFHKILFWRQWFLSKMIWVSDFWIFKVPTVFLVFPAFSPLLPYLRKSMWMPSHTQVYVWPSTKNHNSHKKLNNSTLMLTTFGSKTPPSLYAYWIFFSGQETRKNADGQDWQAFERCQASYFSLFRDDWCLVMSHNSFLLKGCVSSATQCCA